MTNVVEQVLHFHSQFAMDLYLYVKYHKFTESYKHSGQNIAIYGRISGYGETKPTIERMFNLWFNEYKLADMSYIDRFHPSK